jgi:holliday junction DNA helicase RuvA
MFAYLEGRLAYKSPSMLHLDVHGVGYEINITLQTYSRVRDMEACRLFIHEQVKEDGWTLYGFFGEDERSTFRMLLNINGVGAATSRIILSSLTSEELARAIQGNDSKTLEKIKGIGAKTAQRIILELKDKLTKQHVSALQHTPIHNTVEEDALLALVNLGINKAAAESAMQKSGDLAGMTVEEVIKKALRSL